MFQKLQRRYLAELNFLTLSFERHSLAVKDIMILKDEKFFLIQNRLGSSKTYDFGSSFSDDILKTIKNYENINSKYPSTGLILPNTKDIKKNYKI